MKAGEAGNSRSVSLNSRPMPEAEYPTEHAAVHRGTIHGFAASKSRPAHADFREKTTMSVQKSMLPAVVITGSSLLVGCGSNGSCGSGGSCNVPPPGTGGVSAGTVGGTAAVAILANNGDMRIGVQNGTYYHLSVAPQTTTIAGSYFAYSTGAAFPNGTDATTGTVSGTEGASTLDGTLTDHSGKTEALTLNDNPVYTTGSALA